MLHILFTNLELHKSIMLIIVLIFVLIYEAINGFHDTANAVAIIIYTRSLCSQLAVIISGIFNFLGVLLGGLSVAYTIVHLLPIDILLNINSVQSLAMMFSMLFASILWNLGTWYLGLPSSSSHTLIGSIIGISLINAYIKKNSIIQAMNIPKITEIFISLIISPIVGLLISGFILIILRKYWNNTKKRKHIHLTPIEREKNFGKDKPPFLTRISLIISSASLSFSHGANDGQKGIGIIMLVLISVYPSGFVVNMNSSSYDINITKNAIYNLQEYYINNLNKFTYINNINNLFLNNFIIPSNNNNDFLNKKISYSLNIKPITYVSLFNYKKLNKNHNLMMHNCSLMILPNDKVSFKNSKISERINFSKEHIFHYNFSKMFFILNKLLTLLKNVNNFKDLNVSQRIYLRHLLMCIADTIYKVSKLSETSISDKKILLKIRHDLLHTIEYAPIWIVIAVALSLSLGTMIGWRRVSITIGEKIGKKGMTYAQGLSAQITSTISISLASYTGMPVSTTHVLSSAITGAMIVDKVGIQNKTIKNILLAWLLTLPVSILLSSSLFWLILKIIK